MLDTPEQTTDESYRKAGYCCKISLAGNSLQQNKCLP